MCVYSTGVHKLPVYGGDQFPHTLPYTYMYTHPQPNFYARTYAERERKRGTERHTEREGERESLAGIQADRYTQKYHTYPFV